jgi:hypothetical protein
MRVEDGVRNAIADFVRMAFADRLRSEKKPETTESGL